jgi:hypothetical protein
VELFFRLHLHYGDVKLLEVDFEELVLTQHVLSELSLVLSRVCPLDVVLEDDFELFGWLFNHTLVATLATLSESETFGILNPIEYNAKKGEWNYSFGRKTLKQAGSTVKSMGDPTGLWNTTGQKMFDAYSNFALFLEEKDNAYWKKDTGPYWFQKSGEPKFWKDIFSIFGFTGTQVSPVEAAEKEMYKQRR